MTFGPALHEPEGEGAQAAHARLEVGSLVIDRIRWSVAIDARPVDLTFLEFEALWTIASLRGRVATHRVISEALWDAEPVTAALRIAVIVSRIRRKLGDARGMIMTASFGYRLNA